MNTLQVAAARIGLVLAFVAFPLHAQTVAGGPTSNDPKKEPDKLERFIVTGSYIPSTETAIEAGSSPVSPIDRKVIDESGYTSTAELLQQITVSNANSVPISNNATGFTPGASAISLRGLGPEATLVLINGRRVAPYPVGVGGSTAFVDLNSIPLSAIESIEVLKDGASALYGADAVAGVINIKLRRALDGTEAFFSYGNTIDQDSHEIVASLATGRTTDKLNIIAGLNYSMKAAIMNRDRAYSRTPPFLSTNASPGNFEITRFAAATALNQSLTAPIPGLPNNAVFFFAQSGAVPANNGVRPASQYTYSLDRSATYNFNETSMSYPDNERKGGFAFLERKLFRTDNIKGYVDLLAQEVRTENQLAPGATGDFSTAGRPGVVIPARTANPILTVIDPFFGIVQQVPAGTLVPRGIFAGPGTQIVNGRVQRLAAPGALNPFNPFNQDIADGSRLRLPEFGNRVTRNRTEATMFTAGIKGDNVAGKWNFDASFSYSAVRDQLRATQISATLFNALVDASSPLFDPRSPFYAGTTTPYNPFGYYRNPIAGNAALADVARVTTRDVNHSTLGQASFVVSTSDLWRLPAGSIGFALGGDYRREQLEQNPDPLGMLGDIVGASPTAQTNAQRKIGGLFAELRVPLLRQVEGSVSARHEKFFTSHRATTVPKFALRVRPFGDELTLRTSYSKGFREPSLYELYSSPISALQPIQDPLDGFIEPEQPVTLSGNRRLQPERTDYFNIGFVWTPTAPRLKGLTLGVDHWEITRKGTVEANPQNTVYRAFGALPGGLFPGEDVLLSPSGFISVVNAVFFNVGRTQVQGWDFSGSYQLPTDRLGRWEISTVWTLIDKFDRASVQGAPLTSVLGDDATGTADYGYLRWRGLVRLNWSYKAFTVYGAAHYTDGFMDRDIDNHPFRVADSLTYDGQVSYAFRNTLGRWLRDTKLTVGARNLLDRDPPRALGGGSNATGYPGFLYTAENFFWYASLTRKF